MRKKAKKQIKLIEEIKKEANRAPEGYVEVTRKENPTHSNGYSDRPWPPICAKEPGYKEVVYKT